MLRLVQIRVLQLRRRVYVIEPLGGLPATRVRELFSRPITNRLAISAADRILLLLDPSTICRARVWIFLDLPESLLRAGTPRAFHPGRRGRPGLRSCWRRRRGRLGGLFIILPRLISRTRRILAASLELVGAITRPVAVVLQIFAVPPRALALAAQVRASLAWRVGCSIERVDRVLRRWA